MTIAVEQTPPDVRLTLFSDCRVLLQILQRWQRHDFGPYVEAEDNWDILETLLLALKRRTAMTTIIYTRAHRVDPENGEADHLANLGCYSDTVVFERATEPFRLVKLDPRIQGRAVLSPHGRTKKVERYAREFQGEFQDQLLEASGAKSTDSTLKEGLGRLMGKVVQEIGLGTKEIRDFLQGRANCFPTAKLVARNTKGAEDDLCPLCKREVETFGHMHMRCKELEGARHEAHDMIAEAIFTDIEDGLGDGAELTLRPRVGQITAGTFDRAVQSRLDAGRKEERATNECPKDIVNWEPDGILTHLPSKRIVILEFTRGMSEQVVDMEDRDALKSQKYHSTLVYITALYPQWRVEYYTFVMGVLTSYPEQDWEQKLTALGLSGVQREALETKAVRACIAAGHMVANARRSALAALGGSHRNPRQGVG